MLTLAVGEITHDIVVSAMWVVAVVSAFRDNWTTAGLFAIAAGVWQQ